MKKTLILTSIFAIMTVAPAVACIPSSAFMREEVATQIATAVSSKVDTAASANQTLPDGTQPSFYDTFYGASNMTGSIPENLFAGISGNPATYMFERTLMVAVD